MIRCLETYYPIKKFTSKSWCSHTVYLAGNSKSTLPIMNPQLYFWLKTLHLVFAMAWMVSLFYLPRILVHFKEAQDAGQGTERLSIMARSLFKFGNIMAIVALGLGLWIAFGHNIYGNINMFISDVLPKGWLHTKVLLVVIMFGYNGMTLSLFKKAEKGALSWSSKGLRWFNELPLILLIAIIFLVIAKPF